MFLKQSDSNDTLYIKTFWKIKVTVYSGLGEPILHQSKRNHSYSLSYQQTRKITFLSDSLLGHRLFLSVKFMHKVTHMNPVLATLSKCFRGLWVVQPLLPSQLLWLRHNSCMRKEKNCTTTVWRCRSDPGANGGSMLRSPDFPKRNNTLTITEGKSIDSDGLQKDKPEHGRLVNKAVLWWMATWHWDLITPVTWVWFPNPALCAKRHCQRRQGYRSATRWKNTLSRVIAALCLMIPGRVS